MRKREIMSLLLTAALTMMSGCSNDQPVEPPQSGSAEKSDKPVVTDDPDISDDIDGLIQIKDDLSGGISELHNIMSFVPGLLTGERKEITEEEGAEIDRLIFEDEQNFLVSSSGTAYSAVKIRDWNRYTSMTAKEKLSFYEAVFYDRLDKVCRAFLEEPSHGAVKVKDHYFLNGVDFSDLGLTESDAADLYVWFKYNNPHYYFLDNMAVSTTALFPIVMDLVMESGDAAELTNTIFDKLDGWIEECSDNKTTTWQKIQSINRKICEAAEYDPKALSKVSGGNKEMTDEELKEALGGKNRTIYSVLMSPETVCAGYAVTFNAMANAMGIDSLVH